MTFWQAVPSAGGRGRLSTMVAGVFLLFLIIVLGDVVKQIPMAALVGVMIMVSIGTFDWKYVRGLNKIPRSEALVMIITVAIVVYTDNLAMGVAVGVRTHSGLNLKQKHSCNGKKQKIPNYIFRCCWNYF